MKVMFKKDIKKQIDFASSRGSGTTIDGIFYPQQFAKPEYFEVRPCGSLYYEIIKPGNLHSYSLIVKHTIPYLPIKFDLDDKLFEWGE